MYYAYVFYQDPTTTRYCPRRVGPATKLERTAIRMVEKSAEEGYVIKLGNKVPVWQNVKPVVKQRSI